MEDRRTSAEIHGEPLILQQNSTIRRKPLNKTTLPTRFASLRASRTYQSVPNTSENDPELVDSSASNTLVEHVRTQPPRSGSAFSQSYGSKDLNEGSACQQTPNQKIRLQVDWKPPSLHTCFVLIVFLLIHLAIYCVAWQFTQDRGIFIRASSGYDWIFQFGPSLVAVGILIWCTQISRDYTSIAGFFPENIGSRSRYKQRLYFRGARQHALSSFRAKALIAFALLLLIVQSTIFRKTLLSKSVATTAASTSNKLYLAALADTALPPAGSSWEDTQGIVTKGREGWTVNKISFSVSVVVHCVMIFTILTLRMIHFPLERLWRTGLRSILGHDSTGLVRTPATLVALAEIFRDVEVRQIFRGVDSAAPGKDKVTLLGRTASLIFDQHIQGYQNRESMAVQVRTGVHERPQFQMRLSLTRNPKKLLRIRHAFVPGALRKTILLVMVLLVFIGFGLTSFLVSTKRGFYFWIVDWSTYDTYGSDLAWVQQLLFVLLSLVPGMIFWLWWLKIDTFYRALQPYAGLHMSRTGCNSVCLDYIHTSILMLPFKAAARGHIRLAWLSLMFLLSIVLLVLPAGLFSYNSSSVYDQIQTRPLQILSTGQYRSSDALFDQQVFRDISVKTLLGSTVDQSWVNDNVVFPQVDINDGFYEVTIDGLSAELQCRQIDLEFRPQALGGFIATLNDSQVGQFEWLNFCYFDSEQLSSNDGDPSIADANACPTLRIQLSNATNITTTTSRSSTRSSTSSSQSLSSVPSLSRISSPSSAASISSSVSTYDNILSPSTRTTESAPASTRPGTIEQCYQWYIPQPGEYCEEVANRFGIDWEVLRDYNRDIDSACRNLEAYVPYCVDGMLGLVGRKDRERRDPSENSCTGWRYVPSNCTLNKSGFWLLVNAQGPFNTTSKKITGLNSVQQNTSMICTPSFLSRTVNTTIASSVNLTIQQNNVLSSKKIDIGNWLDSRAGQRFNDYFGTRLIQNGFASSYKQLSDGQILDRMSLFAASNSTTFTGGFSNLIEFQRIASYAFGMVFATIASKPVSSDNTTLFFNAVEMQSNTQPVQLRRNITVATVQRVPLYIIMGYLALIVLSVPCIYLPKSKRTPLDPRYPANAIVNIYDSAFILEVQNIVERGGDPEVELQNQLFAFGVYEGVSTGERRLGIDFAERVTIVSSRARNVLEIDAEKMSMISVTSSNIPEAAEPQTREELAGRGEHDVPIVRLATRRARRSQGSGDFGTARGYQPVPHRGDSDNIIFQNVGDGSNFSPLGWLRGMRNRKSDGTTVSVRGISTPSESDGHSGTRSSSAVRRNWNGLVNLMKGPMGT